MSELLAEVGQIIKPRAAAEAIKRAHQYLKHMASQNKPVERLALRACDYDQIMRAVTANRDEHLPKIDGLRIGNVRITRGGL